MMRRLTAMVAASALAAGTAVALAPAAFSAGAALPTGPALVAAVDRVPVIDTLAGHGALPTDADGVVAVASTEEGHDSALVRISVFDAEVAVEVAAAGAPALVVPQGGSASTTVLVPLEDGGLPLSVSAEVEARVELLATFASADLPGATHTLAAPVTRADTRAGLAGAALGSEPVSVGVVGRGGIPVTGVRAVYLTATFDVAVPSSARIADQEFPLPAGRTAVTTVAVLAEEGAVPVALAEGTGHLRVDVRGWVSEAAQDAPAANVVGSYLPAFGTEPHSVRVPVDADVSLEELDLTGQVLTLGLVWGTADGERAFVDAGDGPDGRARGVLADDGRIDPQLTVIDGTRVAARGADVEVTVLPVGGILAAELPGEPSIDMSLTDGADVDLSATGWFSLTGTVGGVRDIDRVEILAGRTVVGTAALSYRGDGVGWRFETAAPRAGKHELTARVVTHGGAQADVSRVIDVVLPDAETAIVSPETVVIPPEGADGQPLVSAVGADEVIFGADPGLAPGAIIVSDATAAAPSGFLRRIVAIDRTEAGWRVLTEAATLTDALVQASVTDEVDALVQGAAIDTDVERRGGSADVEIVDEGRTPVALVTGAAVEVGPFEDASADGEGAGTDVGGRAGAATASARPQGFGDSLARPGLLASRTAAADEGGFGLEEDVTAALSMRAAWATDSSRTWDLTSASDPRYLQSKGEIEASGGLAMSAEAQLSATLEITLRIRATFDWGRPEVEVADFSVLLKTSARGKAELSAHLEARTVEEFEILFAHVELPSLTFYIPTPTAAVPVVIENTFRLFMRSSVEARVSLEAHFAIQRTETYGFRYSSAGGVEDVHEGPTISTRTPALDRHASAVAEGSLDAVATFEPELSMKIYGMLGPVFTGAFGPRITAELVAAAGEHTPVLDARVRLYLRLGLEGRLEFTVPIVDHQLLDHELFALSRDFPAADWTWTGDEIFDQTGSERPAPPPLSADWAYLRSIGFSLGSYDDGGFRRYLVDIERDRLIQMSAGSPPGFEGRVLGVLEGTTLHRLDLAPAPVADAALFTPDGTVLVLDQVAEPDQQTIDLRRYDPATGVFGENRAVVFARSCETIQGLSVDADPTSGVLLVVGSYARYVEEDGACQSWIAESGTRAWTLRGDSLATVGEFTLPVTFETQHILFAPDGEDAYLLASQGGATELVTVPLTPGILRGPETLADIPWAYDAAVDPRDGSLVLAAGSYREDERSSETNLWRLDPEWGDVLESPAPAAAPVPDNLEGVRHHHHFTGLTFDGDGHLYAIETNYRVPWEPPPATLWMSGTGEFSELAPATTNWGSTVGSVSSWIGNQRLTAAPGGAVLWSNAAQLIRPGGFERYRNPITLTLEDAPLGETVVQHRKSAPGCENDYWERRLCVVTSSGVLVVVDDVLNGIRLTTPDGTEPVVIGTEGMQGHVEWIEEVDRGVVVAFDAAEGASLALVDLEARTTRLVRLGEYGLTRARSVDEQLRLVLTQAGGMGSAVLATVDLDGTGLTLMPLRDPAGVDPTDLAAVTSGWPSALAVDEERGIAYLLDGGEGLYRVDLADGRVRWVSAPAWTSTGSRGGSQLAVTDSGDVVGIDGNTVFSFAGDGTPNWSRDILLPGQEHLAPSEELSERENLIGQLTVVGDDVLIMARPTSGARPGHDGYIWRLGGDGEPVAGGRLPVELSENSWDSYFWFRLQQGGVVAWSTGVEYGLVHVG